MRFTTPNESPLTSFHQYQPCGLMLASTVPPPDYFLNIVLKPLNRLIAITLKPNTDSTGNATFGKVMANKITANNTTNVAIVANKAFKFVFIFIFIIVIILVVLIRRLRLI